ncbi:hypothetical protein GCM10019016_029030 [Streptomyces prasinosporus]|uniref:Amine oxidase domain-containing protein n=1 Tax=Streptomyces prasinosporus TaxID=68256 RepID=A0ABP6TKP6_9ACTN
MARIAVIGAGMGAMAAAARLAVAGHRVAVYERTETYGGALRRRERDGFSFDTGPGLLTLPAVYRDLFVKTGREPLEERVELVQVDPSSRHVFADGTEVSLPNASRAGVVAALDEALGPGAGRRWGDFLVRAREAWERSRRPLLEEPLWPNWRVLAEREPYPAVPHKRLLRTRRAGTLAEVGAWELRDPRLAALLESHALAYGLDPRDTPASAAVLPYMEHAFGTWYVRGGMRELARAVHERCAARRVEFRFGAGVARILEKDGRAAGVELLDGTVCEADHVVAGVDPHRLELMTGRPLYGDGDVRPGPAEHRRPGRFTVLLALRGPRDPGAAHRTVVHAPDRTAELDFLAGRADAPVRPTVTVLRPDDPALGPDAEHESAVVSPPCRTACGGVRAKPASGSRICWSRPPRPPSPGCGSASCGARCARPTTTGRRRAPRGGAHRLPLSPPAGAASSVRPTPPRSPGCHASAAGPTPGAAFRTPACRARWSPG